MRTFNKKPLALGVAAGVAMLAASTGAIASSAGTDFGLSAHIAAGGMGGAAYTRPQEASAAVFGNPATLSQFPGVNFNFGATLLMLEEVANTQSADITVAAGVLGPAAVNLSSQNKSVSDADNYIIPTLGLTLQISPNLTLGMGLEADAGLGADYRDDPISLVGGQDLTPLGLTDGSATLPLAIEVISFNANLAAAYKMSEKLSVGASLTIGFGLAQLGTVGPTGGLGGAVAAAVAGGPFNGALGAGGALVGPSGNAFLDDFGGTTASVHDIGFGASLGATYELSDGITTSLTVKSPVQYSFSRISYNAIQGEFEDLRFEQPLEIIAGVALDDVLMPGLLIEADLIWKNWENAQPYDDIWTDQFVLALGGQYTVGDWQLRAGYQWTQSNFKSDPGNSLGDLDAIGTLPLGDDSIDAIAGGPLSRDIMAVGVQSALAPVIWEHTVTAGVGYNFTDAVRVDAFASYAFSEDMTRYAPVIDAALSSGAAFDSVSTSYKAEIDPEIFVGIGINVALP